MAKKFFHRVLINVMTNISFKNQTFFPPIEKTSKIKNINKTYPAIDKFLLEVDIANKQNEAKETFCTRLFNYPIFSILSLPLIAQFTYNLVKTKQLKKQITKKLLPQDALKAYAKKNIMTTLAFLMFYILSIITTNKYIKYKQEKEYKNTTPEIDAFNKKEGANINLSVKNLGYTPISALMDSFSGNLVINKNFQYDPILALTHKKHLINHELVHAKQFILIARSENGIEKMNYAVLKNILKNFTPNSEKEINEIYTEIQNGGIEKYKNQTFEKNGIKVNLIDFITAIYKLINEPNTSYKDLPIVINKDYYQKIREKKGKLSPQEELKADKYLEAYLEYPNKITFFSGLNPKSTYKQNLLEKEAYKVNPWYTL